MTKRGANLWKSESDLPSRHLGVISDGEDVAMSGTSLDTDVSERRTRVTPLGLRSLGFFTQFVHLILSAGKSAELTTAQFVTARSSVGHLATIMFSG